MSHRSRLSPRIDSQRSRGGTERVWSRGCVAAIVALSVAAALLVAPASGGAALNSVGSAQVTAASSPPGPVSSAGYEPAVGFTALEYPVRFYQRIFNADEPLHTWGPKATDGYTWFGEVTADRRSEDTDLSFAVEGQHGPAGYQFCETPSTCDDVYVRVTSAGLLYLHKQQRTDFQQGYFADFPTRTVELSAADADTPLKVYREVLVGPPTPVTGCEDYGENNPDAYACLFLREVIPEGVGGGSNEATLRASLPGLVQPAANYSLVFAEEFDGTPPAANAAGCRDGLSTLDNDVWNYKDACHSDFVDSLGEPCGNVVDGHLVIADTGTCRGGFGTDTGGKLHVKYGYVELKFTINMDMWGAYSNYNIILFARDMKLRYLLDRYGVEMNDWEDFLTNLDTELDLIEWDMGSRAFIGHQYADWHYKLANPNTPPTWSSKWYSFCGRGQWWSIINNPNRPCQSYQTFTVTLGTEWTPRGYRTFITVDEFQDRIVVPKDKIDVNVKPVSGNRAGNQRTLRGSEKDAYFEYLDPNDTDTLLEQVAVSHVPLPVNVGTWGYMDPEKHPYIRTRMKIDYIRVWQPADHYSTMEPVYQ